MWELLAVVHFMSQFRHFLLGGKFLDRTDNSAVRYGMRTKSDSYDPKVKQPDGIQYTKRNSIQNIVLEGKLHWEGMNKDVQMYCQA